MGRARGGITGVGESDERFVRVLGRRRGAENVARDTEERVDAALAQVVEFARICTTPHQSAEKGATAIAQSAGRVLSVMRKMCEVVPDAVDGAGIEGTLERADDVWSSALDDAVLATARRPLLEWCYEQLQKLFDQPGARSIASGSEMAAGHAARAAVLHERLSPEQLSAMLEPLVWTAGHTGQIAR